MKENFESALKLVLIHEGGWSDHPQDPGGATMKGVTLETYRRFYHDPDKTKGDLRHITDQELQEIYRAGYWDKCHCDTLPAGVDYAVFDAAVNSGPGRSAKWLQGAVGAVQDGGIGPNTLAKVDAVKPTQMIGDMCDRRLSFLRNLSTWSTFGGGWQKRVDGVRSEALHMCGESHTLPPAVDYDIVKMGSRGYWVRKLQEALGIAADGIFGKDTQTALKTWQADSGLEADGIAGRNTYRGLGLIA